jgi:hypothetical protein
MVSTPEPRARVVHHLARFVTKEAIALLLIREKQAMEKF